ncbi:hypothetical protein LTR36_007868 [Oleoguttula mirabilis]|uniref:Uncharacterized protein n=1 Tax=Oleoguttula mirabilis TaxID=1507867 RepID=A0AAV9J9J2_9PEZI|nr:hypothetical protein LTR36_007868 [Oleoguttula mirabilis]
MAPTGTAYTEFKTYLGPALFNTQHRVEVLGIGDVELEIRRSNSASAKRKGRMTSTITLHNVLHAPGCVTNIFGGPILDYYGLVTNNEGGKLTDLETGATVALLDKPFLWKFWLKGQKRGLTSLDPNGLYAISASWSDAERTRWEEQQQNVAASSATIGAPTSAVLPASSASQVPTSKASPPYTAVEKAFIKDNFRDEFHFLRDHGLSIYKDEDRDEGRRIARAIMSAEGEGGSDQDIDDGDEGNDFLADLEADPMSHLADRFFSEEQLDFIKKHYRHSGNFLLTHGLKPFDDEDCKEGVAIARAFMGGHDE